MKKLFQITIPVAAAFSLCLMVYYFRTWALVITSDITNPFFHEMARFTDPGGAGQTLTNILLMGRSFCAALLLYLAMAACGLKILRTFFHSNSFDEGEELALASALGMGSVSLITLLTGLAGYIGVLIPAVIIAIGFILCFKEFIFLASKIFLAIKKLLSPKKPVVLVVANIVFLLFLLVTLLAAAAPATEPDSLWYHLSLPKLFIQEGGIFPAYHIMPSNWPLAAEMLYTTVMLLDKGAAPQFLNWIIGLNLLLTTWCIFRRCFGSGPNSILAPLILVSIPVLGWEFSNPYSDLTVAWFKLIAVLALLLWYQKKNSSMIALAGLMCGFAMSSKINGVLGVFLAGVIVFVLPSEDGFRKKLRTATKIGLIAALVSAPWYIKTFLWTGDPLWPALDHYLDCRFWNDLTSRDYMLYLRGFLGEVSWNGFIHLPEKLMFLRFNGNLYWPDTTGLLFIPLLIVFFSRRGKKPLHYVLMAGAIAYAAAWFFVSQQNRHLIPAFALFSCLISSTTADKNNRAGSFVTAAVVILSVVQFIFLSAMLSHRFPASVGPVPKNEYLFKALEDYDSITFINEQLPAGSLVLSLWGNSTYYLEKDFILGDPRWQGFIDYNKFDSVEEMNAHLRSLGLTHVLFYSSNLFGVREIDMWIRERLHLRPSDPTAITKLLQLQNSAISSGKWSTVFISPSKRTAVFEIRD